MLTLLHFDPCSGKFNAFKIFHSLIHLISTDPNLFNSYIYCEEIDIEDDQYIAVLNLADKFQLTELVDATLEKVVGTLNTSNFFEFIELWNLFDVSSALKECFDKFITVNTQWIVDQPQFLTLTRDSLALVLKQECLSISEFELFNACLKWARAQCLRAGIEPKSKKLRKALGKLFYFFRISSFDSVKQFLEAANADVFTDTEIVDCVYFLVSNSEREKSIIQKFVSLKKRGHYHSSAASDISSDNLTDAGSLRLSSLRAFSSRYRHERPKPYLLPPHKSSAHSKPYSTRYYPSEKTFSSHYYYGHDRD